MNLRSKTLPLPLSRVLMQGVVGDWFMRLGVTVGTSEGLSELNSDTLVGNSVGDGVGDSVVSHFDPEYPASH